MGLSGNNRIINHDPAKKADKQDNAQEKYEKALKSRYRLDLNQKIMVRCIPVPPAGKYAEGFEKADGSSVSLAKETDASDDSNMVGYVVFSNYRVASTKSIPDQRAKAYSYIFPADNLSDPIKVESSKVELFTGSSNSETVRETYNYLREHQNRDLGIPVWTFWDDKNVIKALGFAKMPRLVCEYDTQKVTASHQTNDEDEWKPADECYFSLPEVMFGTVRKEFGQISLKSRISFSDMVSDRISSNDLDRNVPMVLNSPKPSFYNMYLEDGRTYSSPGNEPPIASGFKRYRSQEYFTKCQGKDNVTSILEVLIKPETVFKGRVMFHNLKKEELGALLWCLSFGESLKDPGNSQFYHSLGHGKPYGLGAVQFKEITVKVADYDSFDMKILSSEELDAMMKSFAAMMDKEFEKIGDKDYVWSNSRQVEILKSLARLHDDYKIEGSLVYNELDDFSKLRGLSVPGVACLDDSGFIPRTIASSRDEKLRIKDLGKKYLDNVNYVGFLQENPLMHDWYEEHKKILNDRKAEIKNLAMLSEISCEPLKTFFSSPDYKRLKKNPKCAPGELPVKEITKFLNDMVNVPPVNPADKKVLVDILSQEWLKTFTGVKAKMKERKALVRQVKEKHGIQ